jgi:hypothetical protein
VKLQPHKKFGAGKNPGFEVYFSLSLLQRTRKAKIAPNWLKDLECSADGGRRARSALEHGSELHGERLQ